MQGRVIFTFRGVLTTVDPVRFDAVMKRMPNMQFGGPYLPHQDLEGLYRDVDFAWALDLEHTDHNSRWLLPCRFYEAGYFGVPCLAVHGFEVGSVLERYRIGFTFAPPLEDQLVRFFETLTPADYDHISPSPEHRADQHVRGRRRHRPAVRDAGRRQAAARLIITQSNSTSRSELSRLTG